ncbi:Tyrosine--tRNA ligase [Piscirickettsia salmonis]|uniref:Tyrosine--tRNA ligase n=1 Tax=Piscirickettsia salmonis TaxID=1238 RepID=A0A1L6T9S0_PISSA|nr:tyrosine--tRNA ligase [Piscirickettsia salmonis]AKP73129.1 tyrosine--tRNA ligase [Piscirickettsia salmonis LF-89 = ATCC VR-1361]ALB21786.1 tyrosyl-tRNA synthetase [Piscirickettsia salmonis]ALY01971.1 tyrosine--tRNA ligase [Piscirickettsia salmonis]AMA41481.1 tyrosine--tRNA ligase [Piscirickettsia salmonis]AOS33967.1 tyrosine--tRNA ligase [Piscirickettsia salmonis]
MSEVAQALEIIKRGVDEIIVEDELVKKLAAGTPLRVKLGMDPTAADLHLGHTVVLNKMRQLQDLGHEILFLIGDFTATIGDPTGKNITRQPLSAEQVEKNAATYTSQVFKILDENKTQILFNSEWMGQKTAADMIALASSYTVARMLERDDFAKRYGNNQPIAIHEFIYPLVQGYDSVAMKADIELGGTDQKFNLLMGRELQRQYGQRPQTIITMPLLEGLDGVKKMSKSLGNYIGIAESASEMFGKMMSVSDELMWRYYELLSFKPMAEIKALEQAVVAGMNPRDAKVALAKEIVARFHSEQAAAEAYDEFVNRFKKGVLPEDMPEVTVTTGGEMAIGNILKAANLVGSTSEAMRMIQQGAVRIDGERVEDKSLVMLAGAAYVMQVGKRRFARVSLV